MTIKNLSIYKGKKVLVTGNTGFKGSWLSSILIELKSEVIGYALDPSTSPSIYQQLNLDNRIQNQYICDVRNYEAIYEVLLKEKPDLIFHLAAQPLVIESYKQPLQTIDTNVMGTANLLEAVRQLGFKSNVVIVTTDKCYDNKESIYGYREIDSLGGFDPYSASKGAAEILISSYGRSFFRHGKSGDVNLASVRAGNVIGGGDWSENRIIPDIVKSLAEENRVLVRNPKATRPWQHVLEPLSGYLLIGSLFLDPKVDSKEFCTSFNFGPLLNSNIEVAVLVEKVIEYWGNGEWFSESKEKYHEASLLNLSIEKAFHLLNWYPKWNFDKTVKATVDWYRCSIENPTKLTELTAKQVEDYFSSETL